MITHESVAGYLSLGSGQNSASQVASHLLGVVLEGGAPGAFPIPEKNV